MADYRIVLLMGETLLELPVLPEKLSVKRNADSTEKTVLNLGSVNIIKGAKLRQISFNSFFPAERLPSVRAAALKEPLYYVLQIKECMESKKPLRFILLGTDLDINTLMSVESFEYSESYGAAGSIDYKLTLKEWVDYSPRRVRIKANKVTECGKQRSGSPSSAPQGKAVSYTVKAGDCLWSICQAQYGDGSLYAKLYAANKSVMDARNKGTGYPAYTIYAGEVLTLPPKEEL
jgi:nucleoid-associated protein YgaU